MYSKEQITKIRSLINDYFERGDVYDKLKQRIESQGLTVETLDGSKLTQILQETNLLDNLALDVKYLEEIQTYNDRNKKRNEFVNPDKLTTRSISLRIYKGKAFLDFVKDELNNDQFLQLYLCMGNQRFCSERVRAQVDPEFNELFIFELKTEGQKANQDLLILSKNDNPIEISIVYIDEKNQTRNIYSQKLVEWRFLLCYGNISLNIEMPLTQESKLKSTSELQYARQSVGLLQIHLDLLPKSGLSLLPENIITQQLSKEKALLQAQVDRFHGYSSSWWNDYKELKLPIRPVKIYAESQDGIWRASCSFISELSGVRGIPTPYDAARFVSLIPMKRTERGPQSSSERTEIWHRFSTFLSIKNGDFEDHCILLCSLLLGFNMDAYVVIGASTDGAHGWVLTRTKTQTKQGMDISYLFWETLTGSRLDIKDPRAGAIYKKIGCIFNHKSFYANIQSNEGVAQTDFNIDDYTKWKAIDPQELINLKPQQQALCLIPPSIRYDQVEPMIENKLKEKITNYRKVLNLATRFDDKLSGIVQIQLNNYKSEKISGISYCQNELQSALKSYIPEGHMFKAFPMQFLHMDVERILEAIKQAPIGAEVVAAKGDQAFHCIRSMLEIYPDDIYALWIVVAVRFRQGPQQK